MDELKTEQRLRAVSRDASLFPDFRDFYRDHNPQFHGVWPCPVGTAFQELHQALADTVADYMDVIATVMSSAAQK